MAKKAKILNGFEKGINLDRDSVDLDDKECLQSKHCILDKPGKVTSKIPDYDNTTSDISEASSGSIVDGKSFIIDRDGKFTRGYSPYLFNSEVVSSGKYNVYSYPSYDLGTYNESSQDSKTYRVNIFESGTAEDIIFRSSEASFNEVGNTKMVLANRTSGYPDDAEANEYIRSVTDRGSYNANVEASNSAYRSGVLFYDNGDSDRNDFYTNDNASSPLITGEPDNSNNPAGNLGLNDHYVHAINSGVAINLDDIYMDESTPDVDYLSYYSHTNSAQVQTVSTSFRTGKKAVSQSNYDNGTQKLGLFTNVDSTGVSVSGKDIFVEFQMMTATAFDSLWIVIDSKLNKNQINYDLDLDGEIGDTQSRIFKFTTSQIESITGQGIVSSGKIKLQFNVEAYDFSGIDFDSSNINQINIMWHPGPNGVNNVNWTSNNISGKVELMRLYDVSIFKSSISTWQGNSYKLSQSRISDGVESLTENHSGIFTPDASSISLEVFKPSSSLSSGSKIYYQEYDDITESSLGDQFLLAETDYNKGVKWVGDEVFTSWGSNTSLTKVFRDRPAKSTYDLETGYPIGVKSINALWENSAVIGQQIYIADVYQGLMEGSSADSFTGTGAGEDQLLWSGERFVYHKPIKYEVKVSMLVGEVIYYKYRTSDDDGDSWDQAEWVSQIEVVNSKSEGAGGIIRHHENGMSDEPVSGTEVYIWFPIVTGHGNVAASKWTFTVGTTDTSMILKSSIGKPYGFPDNQFIDLQIGDDHITAMRAIGDRLFVFTNQNLSIINVSQNYEFLEGVMDSYGITNPRQVCKVGEGIAWVNSEGVILFDGNKFSNLSDEKMIAIDWGNASFIAYEPNFKRLIVIFYGSNDTSYAYYYSFKTNSWVGYANELGSGDAFSFPQTESRTHNGNAYYIAVDGGNNDPVKIIGEADNNSDEIILESGRYDCGNLAQNKVFYKAYITTVNSSYNGNYTSVDWAFDGGDYTGSPINLPISTGRNEIDINGNNKRDIKFKFTSPANGRNNGWEISDIAIIYREKKIK